MIVKVFKRLQSPGDRRKTIIPDSKDIVEKIQIHSLIDTVSIDRSADSVFEKTLVFFEFSIPQLLAIIDRK